MPAIILAMLPFPFFTLPTPRRDCREVLADIERLQADGVRDEAPYLKLANEIAGGVKDF